MSYTNGTQFFILAHKGGPGDEFLENSLSAFQHAAELGCNYLETDVRLADDGKLYLAHDPTSWLPNRPLKISHDLTTLEALFEALPTLYFAIDPKHSRVIEPLADLIVKKNMVDRVCIGSSFDGRAQKVADLIENKTGSQPAMALVSAASSLAALLGTDFLHVPRSRGASFIHVHKKLISQSIIRHAHAKNFRIIAWVVNEKATMLRMKEMGVDGFMTDYPQMAREIGLLDLLH